MATTGGVNIVTDGLILALDAANVKSYPGSGANWYDISGNLYSGSLVNGPTFDSDNGGNIVFDGVDDVIDISSAPFIPGTWNYNEVTVMGFIKPKPGKGTDNNIWTIENSWEVRFNDNGNGRGSLYFASNPWAWKGSSGLIDLDKWQMITFRHNTSTLKGELFVNGEKVYNDNINGNLSSGGGYNTMRIMARHCCGGNHAIGDLSTTYIYNRALSDKEILQNYNATKSRFSL